jgi:hypothetical protein
MQFFRSLVVAGAIAAAGSSALSVRASVVPVAATVPGTTAIPSSALPSTKAYLAAARKRTLEAARAQGLELPKDFLAWVDSDPLVKASVYGCRQDPLPVLLGLRSLEIDLGEDIVRREYTQLALAFAIQKSYLPTPRKASGWNDGDAQADADRALPDISPRTRLVLEIPGDPRTPVDTKDASRALDANDHIINFLEDHDEIEVEVASKELPPLEYDEKGVAKPQGKAVTVMRTVKRAPYGADVIASAALQAEFNAYMAAHGHPEVRIDCGDRAVHWYAKDGIKEKDLRERIKAAHELFHDAYRAKGRMPAERDRAPSASESMAWFIRNDRHQFSAEEREARKWPKFPLNAPWPLTLMLAADDQPLREREEIWEKFRDRGEFRTYGEYIGGIAQQFDMQSARRVAPYAFSYGSIQMMWKDGGVCGTMGNIGARTNRICGVPASTAGQPGHCAIVFMEQDAKTGAFRCKGGQYATGGDEVTSVHAGWNYDDRGGRRPMVFHQSVAWAVNHDLESFVDSLVLLRAWNELGESERARGCERLVREGLARNPFALALVDAAVRSAPDAETAMAVLDAFEATTRDALKDKSYALYRDTVRDLAHARIEQLPAPKSAREAKALLEGLERQQCANDKLLASCWRAIGGEEEFALRTRAAVERYLASNERTKAKRTSEDFARSIKAWAQTIRRKDAKAAWASGLLDLFAGNETLTFRGKKSVDPVVTELSKLAGREVPSLASAS